MHSIVIGGVSRAGKTLLAGRLKERTGYAHFQFDHIITAIAWAFPQLQIGWDQDNLATKSELFLSVVVGKLAYRSPQNFIFECVLFTPRQVAALAAQKTPVTGVFLGYSAANPHKKLRDIREYAAMHPDGTNDFSDETLLAQIHANIEQSKAIESGARECGMKYYDLSSGFGTMDDIVEDIANELHDCKAEGVRRPVNGTPKPSA